MKKLLNTLYVTDPQAFLCKSDDALMVRIDGEKALQLPFHLLESVVLFGYLGCSPAFAGECAQRGITVVFLDESGRFLARIEGPVTGNVLLRRAQYRASDDVGNSLRIAQRFIAAKLHNSRVVLQRYQREYPGEVSDEFTSTVEALKLREQGVPKSLTADELRGLEGDAAHGYFSAFAQMIRSNEEAICFTERTRRPPRDPVNAMLSFFYSILSRDIVSACETVGLDPQVGFLHRDRPGRASLALDLMEELRAAYVDRFVLALFNRKQIETRNFDCSEGGGVVLKDDARKEVLGLWQKRKQEQITHPFLQEKIPLGLIPYVQVQLFARYLRGDIDDYPAFLWR